MANENTRKRPGGPGGPRGMFAHVKPKNTGKTILRLCSYPLLILDDFGMERGTPSVRFTQPA